MMLMILGLVLFLGPHASRLLAPAWRTRCIERHGLSKYKIIYSVVSLVGLVLIVYGYGVARANPVFLYEPPLWTRHIAMPLTLLAFVLIAASHGPANIFRYRLGHPMYAGVKLWAAAHLIANGRLSDVVLFGAFLVWAVAGFSIRRRQDRLAGIQPQPPKSSGTVGALASGIVVWAVFAFWLHRILIGVSPMAM